MDPSRLSRWTRFARKGGIGKCVALQHRVAEQPGDLMFFKNDEITVLMQLSDEDGMYLGYCEGVVGRFAAIYVQFTGKLKTPVIAKRSSKSPHLRSPTPSHGQQPSQSPTPSPSHEEDSSVHVPSSPSAPSVQNPFPLVHWHSSGMTQPPSEPSHHDFLVTPSTSHSSSSSAHESASPPTPYESHSEFPLKVKTGLSVVSKSSHGAENEQPPLLSASHLLRRKVEIPETLSPSMPGSSSSACDTLGTARADAQPPYTLTLALAHSLRPRSPSELGIPIPRLDVKDTGSARLSNLSTTMSDGAAVIGLSMLQDLISGHVDTHDDDEDEDGDTTDHDFSSQSERERTSLEETVDGFPVPPTQIPMPSSRSTSVVLDSLRPVSSVSEYSEDGDGASFYDNYRYSRLSISSKMSKSSGYTVAAVPPPIPSELPPPVRRSQDFQYLAPGPSFEPSEASLPPPGEITPPMTIQTQATHNIPLPLAPNSNQLDYGLSGLATATATSPSLHINFSLPQPAPPGPNAYATLPAAGASFNFSRSGTVSALGQTIETDRRSSSPPSPLTMSDGRPFEQFQSIVVQANVEDMPGAQPQSPASPSVTPSSTTSEKKKRSDPAPPVIMNPTPPHPYTPVSPQTSAPFQMWTEIPTPHTPLRRAVIEPAINPSTSLFLPHPNAPKPNPSPQSPLCWRARPLVSPLPSTSLTQLMHMVAQIRVAPNGLLPFRTIYGLTTLDLYSAVGPVPIQFSVEPLNDISENRRHMVPTTVPSPTLVRVFTRDKLSPALGEGPQLALCQGRISNVIPRARFVPKAGAPRPRSRSFSGFDSPIGPDTRPKERSREVPTARPSTADSASGSRLNPMTARAVAHTTRIHQTRQYTPSPLSISQTTAKKSIPYVVTSVSSSPTDPRSSSTSTVPHRTLTPAKSEPSLRSGPTKSTQAFEAPSQFSTKHDRTGSSRVQSTLSSLALKGSPPSIQISVCESQVLSSRSTSGNEVLFSRQLSASSSRHIPSDVEVSTHSNSHTHMSSPPLVSQSGASFGRSGSLRSKISLSALRAKSSRDDDGLHEGDTVQVKDTDFELIRPNPARPRLSGDSSPNGKSSGSEGPSSFLRVDSPSMSSASGYASDTRSPISPSTMSLPPVVVASTAASIGAVEAHRARELKWIALMTSTPSSHSRKNKKIRKLLQEGVPASVRYQVWAHLTDSRAKRVEGLYAQLNEREKVPAFAEIQRDTQLCFPSDARLSQPNGPLVSLLQAYLTMVPDIQYSKGLAFIAGQLLLQSPEEDAFWIFISLMDSHLRSYFSSNAAHLDIDASLFAKAMEAIYPTVSKKLFVDMAIPPVRICRPWLSSLFVEALPADYFQRVWDIFLSEGVVFLFRIGLAIVTCCHRTLLGVQEESEVLSILTQPPLFLISSSPDLFIELANSFKLKDDDIRKQRRKLKAQVKFQTRGRLSNATWRSSNNVNGSTPASISLPRN